MKSGKLSQNVRTLWAFQDSDGNLTVISANKLDRFTLLFLPAFPAKPFSSP